jgi:chromosomal replication initiation ATPase DnaA
MSSQLTLTFGETLAYSSESFVAHGGVREIAETIVTLAAEKRFALVFIFGVPQVGKTHLAVYCAGLLRSLGKPVEVLSGGSVAEWCIATANQGEAQAGFSLFVDDAEGWMEDPAAEGSFTAAADRISHANGLLVLLSSTPVSRLATAQQIRSRIAAGVQFEVGLAEEEHLDAILKAMTKQRGIRLSTTKRRFVMERVARTVPAVAGYVARLDKTGRSAASSTSIEVLTVALLGGAGK